MGRSKSSLKREVYSNKILPQETRKSQINNLTSHLKQIERRYGDICICIADSFRYTAETNAPL